MSKLRIDIDGSNRADLDIASDALRFRPGQIIECDDPRGFIIPCPFCRIWNWIARLWR